MYLSVLVPVHNSETVLNSTVQAFINKYKHQEVEIILIENGSTDNSFQLSLQLERDGNSDRFEPSVIAIQSTKGLGNAIRKGIESSKGDFVLITADDLPFGFDDLDAFEKLEYKPTITIGSKAHPDSSVNRGLKRSLSSAVFRKLQKTVLNHKIGDTQGTLIVDGNWLRSISHNLHSQNYLITAEIVQAALVNNRSVLESPVSLRPNHAEKKSSVKFKDIWKMATGQFVIRKNWGVPKNG